MHQNRFFLILENLGFKPSGALFSKNFDIRVYLFPNSLSFWRRMNILFDSEGKFCQKIWFVWYDNPFIFSKLCSKRFIIPNIPMSRGCFWSLGWATRKWKTMISVWQSIVSIKLWCNYKRSIITIAFPSYLNLSRNLCRDGKNSVLNKCSNEFVFHYFIHK